jgi:hypothetical protein
LHGPTVLVLGVEDLLLNLPTKLDGQVSREGESAVEVLDLGLDGGSRDLAQVAARPAIGAGEVLVVLAVAAPLRE